MPRYIVNTVAEITATLAKNVNYMSLVAIVGRPNVGKSTLFNRLVGMRQAIVDDTAGVTRDRHYGRCDWCGKEFSVVDTGGYTTNSDDVFESAIREQVQIAIEEADAILFMVEAGTGITDYDAEISDILRRSRKPVVLCVNKVDSGDKMLKHSPRSWTWRNLQHLRSQWKRNWRSSGCADRSASRRGRLQGSV